MGPEQLLEGLTEPQRAAVTHGPGPLLVLAGPGSGKTRVITHRAAYLACTIAEPRHILAITFTNKAANEMAERMRRLGIGPGMTCSTFHSFCARLLRIHADRVGLQPNYSIFDEADQAAAMRDAIERASLRTEHFPPAVTLNQISRAKNDMISVEQYTAAAIGFQQKAVARIYEAYEAALAEQNAVDFDDLLVKAALLLGEEAEIRDKLEDRYRFVLVDEYQDTNHAQYLIARGLSLDHENLCVTGDPDQSIYGWRGASIHNILQFEEDFPNAAVVRLEQNYRSTPQILRAADAVIAHNRRRKHKTLWTDNHEGPPVRLAECESNQAEASFVACEILRHVESGGTYNHVAVFYRTNALSRGIETALRQAQIPYQVARGVAFFQRKEVKDVLAYLKVLANPLDLVSLERIINVPARGIGDKTVERIRQHAARTGQAVLAVLDRPDDIPDVPARTAAKLRAFAEFLRDAAAVAERGSVQDTVEHVVQYSGLSAALKSTDEQDPIENVYELINVAAEYDRQHPAGDGSLTDWLQQISLVADVDAIDPAVGAVTLMTLHAAKGLEFDTVFIAGVEDGILPHERSRKDLGGIEEERRLFFVGMTRARRALTISCAKWRDFRGMSNRTSRSVFVTELPREEIARLRIGEDGQARYDGADGDDSAVRWGEFTTWRAGQLVRHPDRGIGKLVSLEPQSRQTRARVVFPDGEQETYVLEYTKLEIIDPDEMEWES